MLSPINFRILLNDEEITALPVDSKDTLDIAIEELKPPGMVSLLEEYSARKEGGYNIFEWEQLDPLQRAAEVAHCRIMKAIEYQQYKKSETSASTQRGRDGI